jgi:malonyl-CoA/methylmalonyl-CoA synthetase
MTDNHNLYHAFERQFLAAGDAPALSPPRGKPGLSYRDLAEGAARYANALLALGVKPGDRVTVQVEKSAANVLLYLGALKAGAVYQPLNTAYSPSELDYFISDARPTVIVSDPASAPAARDIAGRHGGTVVTLDASDHGEMADLATGMSAVHDTVSRTPDDLAGLLYTSGTTGRSKGAMITHGNLVSNTEALHEAWRFTPGDVLLHALPIFHVHGLYVALGTAFLNRSEILWHQKFDADAVMRDLSRASVMMGVPTFYTRLVMRDDLTADSCAHVRLFVSGSAPLLAETHKTFEAKTNHRILERYGMTETGMITSNPYDGERRAGTVGYPLRGISVRIADEEGRDVATGEVGMIEVKGPNVFKGYWGMPEETAKSFRADGYFVTGDLGVMEPDGRVSIVGRGKDLIISGGLNVYPKEIEIELDAMQGVTESAVIGVPHPDFGESVVAVVTGSPPPEPEMIAQLSGRLAKFKIPKRIFTIPELPRNVMGKVQKSALRQKFADTFREGA